MRRRAASTAAGSRPIWSARSWGRAPGTGSASSSQLSSACSSGTTSSGSGYRPSIDFVNTSAPSTCTSKMPFAPGTTSTAPTTDSHSSRILAARPAAFGLAPQGTQYSIRMWRRSAISPTFNQHHAMGAYTSAEESQPRSVQNAPSPIAHAGLTWYPPPRDDRGGGAWSPVLSCGASTRTCVRISPSSSPASIVAAPIRRARLRSTSRAASSSGSERAERRRPPQQKRFTTFTAARQRECLARERRPRRRDRVELVVLALQPPLGSWRATELKHRLAAAGKSARKAGAVAAAALDRPAAPADRVPVGETERCPITAPVRGDRRSSDHRARGHGHDSQHVLLAVGVNTNPRSPAPLQPSDRSSDSRHEGGRAPDQASSGRQTGVAAPPGRIIRKAPNAASHLTSHKQHDNTRLATAPDKPTQPSLTVT
jgi:hypothetical protein